MKSGSGHETSARASDVPAGQPRTGAAVPDELLHVLRDIARAAGSESVCDELARHATDIASRHSAGASEPAIAARGDDPCRRCKVDENLLLTALHIREELRAAGETRKRQTRFLAVLAHELRAPLAPIRTSASMLDRLSPADLLAAKGVIERAVAHMMRLVSDLLDASRLSSGKMRLELSTLDLSEVIVSAVGSCRAAMDSRLQRLEVTVPSCDLTLRGDPVRLTQIVQNLLDNASKYTQHEGSISLTVAASERQVTLTVADNGIGISQSSLPTIFEPFSQEARAVGFDGVGLGLGLSVVDGLVKAHGGTIAVSSGGLGRGTAFLVTLPRNGPSTGQIDTDPTGIGH